MKKDAHSRAFLLYTSGLLVKKPSLQVPLAEFPWIELNFQSSLSSASQNPQ
jgi:hypothetical protein